MNRQHGIQATVGEHLLACPGDELIRNAAGSLTHAIIVHCNRKKLWPWLIQMGADRAGWYSYDRLDNGGRHSAERILDGLQHPFVGTVLASHRWSASRPLRTLRMLGLPGCATAILLRRRPKALMRFSIGSYPSTTSWNAITLTSRHPPM